MLKYGASPYNTTDIGNKAFTRGSDTQQCNVILISITTVQTVILNNHL